MRSDVKFKWYGPKVTQEIRDAAARGLHLGAELVLEESNRVVPIEVGTPGLLSSGVASSDPEQLRAMVSYDTPYAVVQHEDLTLHHDLGRKAKYLEDTVNDPVIQRGVGELIAREIKRRTA